MLTESLVEQRAGVVATYVLYLQFPLIKPYVQFSRIRLSDYLHPAAFAIPAWPPGIVSSEVPGLLWSS